jgi:hypothetical protein
MRQLLSFRKTSLAQGSTDLGAHASTSELQKDFSGSPTPGSTDSGAHASTSELQNDFLPLQEIQRGEVRQVMSFRKTSPSQCSTVSGAHAQKF